MKHYCARLVKPEQMPTEPRRELVHDDNRRPVFDPVSGAHLFEVIPLDTNPLCGILGLPPRAWDPSKAYLGGRFSMPVVGGPREFCQPFEWESFDQAMEDIRHPDTHKLGLSFDWPVPVDSVQWSLRLYCHGDGSRCVAVVDLPWVDFRLRWLAAIGAIESINQRVVVSINQRIVPVEGLRMPEPYLLGQCSSYRYASPRDAEPKPGAVDEIARILRP